jgi:hypothetical protein
MGTLNFYTVRWHREVGAYGSKKMAHYGECRQDHVAAADANPGTIIPILTTKYSTEPGTIVLDSVGNAGPGLALN